MRPQPLNANDAAVLAMTRSAFKSARFGDVAQLTRLLDEGLPDENGYTALEMARGMSAQRIAERPA